MNLITLYEFKKLTGLSDTALSWLLCNNKLNCRTDPEKGILVDVDDPSVSEMMRNISSMLEHRLSEDERLLKERLACIIKDKLADIVEEALSSRHR